MQYAQCVQYLQIVLYVQYYNMYSMYICTHVPSTGHLVCIHMHRYAPICLHMLHLRFRTPTYNTHFREHMTQKQNERFEVRSRGYSRFGSNPNIINRPNIHNKNRKLYFSVISLISCLFHIAYGPLGQALMVAAMPWCNWRILRSPRKLQNGSATLRSCTALHSPHR